MLFDNFLQIEGPDVSWGSGKNPFQFAKALPPAGKFSSSQKRKWVRERGEASWKRALLRGEVEPSTVREWKEVHWGAIPRGVARQTSGGFLFRSEGIPEALIDGLRKKFPEHRFVLASRSGEDFSCARILAGKTYSPEKSLLEFSRAAEEEDLLDFFDCRLRTDARLVSGSEDDLLRGKVVRVLLQDQKLSLQRESFWRELRGDVLIEEWERPRDVMIAWSGELRFWLDLCLVEKQA